MFVVNSSIYNIVAIFIWAVHVFEAWLPNLLSVQADAA